MKHPLNSRNWVLTSVGRAGCRGNKTLPAHYRGFQCSHQGIALNLKLIERATCVAPSYLPR